MSAKRGWDDWKGAGGRGRTVKLLPATSDGRSIEGLEAGAQYMHAQVSGDTVQILRTEDDAVVEVRRVCSMTDAVLSSAQWRSIDASAASWGVVSVGAEMRRWVSPSGRIAFEFDANGPRLVWQ